jgi:hypothetical protein
VLPWVADSYQVPGKDDVDYNHFLIHFIRETIHERTLCDQSQAAALEKKSQAVSGCDGSMGT